mgnify:CR=1 FL=1
MQSLHMFFFLFPFLQLVPGQRQDTHHIFVLLSHDYSHNWADNSFYNLINSRKMFLPTQAANNTHTSSPQRREHSVTTTIVPTEDENKKKMIAIMTDGGKNGEKGMQIKFNRKNEW